MKIIPEPVVFEWDEGNSGKNFKKHRVSDKEAEEIFSNTPFRAKKDLKHSQKEERFQALGQTNQGRLLFSSFTIRNGKIRVISTRDMNIKEKKIYEKVKKT